jgi:hypothetical protein
MVAIVEPFFIALGADVDVYLVMVAQGMRVAMQAIAQLIQS